MLYAEYGISTINFFLYRHPTYIKWHVSWTVEIKPYLYIILLTRYELPHDKTNNVAVRPVKTQISLGICPVWSESSLWAQWAAKDPSFLHADSEDSDQTGRMPRLIWVFAGRTVILLVLSWGGSYLVVQFKLLIAGGSTAILPTACTVALAPLATIFILIL